MGSSVRSRGRGRPPPGPRGRDRAARVERPGAHARPRERGAQARAAAAGVGEPDRIVGRGLVPDRDGGGRVCDADRGHGGRRVARVDRRRPHRRAGARRERARREGARDRRGPGRARSTGPGRTRARAHVHVGRRRSALARRARGGACGVACRGAVAQPVRALRHRPRGRPGRGGDGGERGRADLHGRLRPHPRHVGLRHARRPRLDLPDPPGAGLRAADHRRARGEHGDCARPRGAWRGCAPLARPNRDPDPCRHGGRDPDARPARRGDRRGRGLGSGGHDPHRLPVAARVGRARRPARASSDTARSGCRSSARPPRASSSACCSWRSGWTSLAPSSAPPARCWAWR